MHQSQLKNIFKSYQEERRSVLPGERSFTLVETVIALSLMAFLIIQMGGVQGNAISFAEYGRRVSEASWLAKRLMGQVEYHATFRPFKELTTSIKDQKFEDAPEYSYDIEIQEWKLNIGSILAGALSAKKGADGEASSAGGLGEIVKTALDQSIGDDAFKMAMVTVYWPEGAARNSTSLGLILVNQEKMDTTLAGLRSAYESLLKKENTGAAVQQQGSGGGSQGATTGGGKPQTGGASGGSSAGSSGGTGGPATGGGGSP